MHDDDDGEDYGDRQGRDLYVDDDDDDDEEDAADHGSKSVAKEGRSEGAKSTTGSEPQIRVTGPGGTLQKPADRKLVSRVSSTCGWHLGILV